MSIVKMNDKTSGELVWIQHPHMKPVKIGYEYSRESLYKAFGVYEHFSTYKDWADFKSNFDEEADADTLEHVHIQLKQAGVSDNEPFIETYFSGCDNEYIAKKAFDIEDIFYQLLQDDMHSAELFEAEDGETYKDFVERIYEGSRGHNAPSMTQIKNALYLDDEEEE